MNTSTTCEGYVVFMILGLGALDQEFSDIRGSVGFLTMDKLVYEYQTSFVSEEKFHCKMTKGIIENRKVVLVKPMVEKNLSGQSVVLVKTHYNISLENIFVIHDDICLEVGKAKLKTGGSHGGHLGIKSMDAAIGEDYHRIRIGVGKPPGKEREVLHKFLTSTFNESEYRLIKRVTRNIIDNLDLMFRKNFIRFSNKLQNVGSK